LIASGSSTTPASGSSLLASGFPVTPVLAFFLLALGSSATPASGSSLLASGSSTTLA
jgi:hypothetical protein